MHSGTLQKTAPVADAISRVASTSTISVKLACGKDFHVDTSCPMTEACVLLDILGKI